MLQIAERPWRDFLELKELLDLLSPALIVGGAVRNSLLGLEIGDIDIATEHSPDVVKDKASQAGFHVIPTGLAHGTVTCFKVRAYEVTTLRIDKVTDGRHAKVEFCTSWEEDAKRRDFTMNALYCDFNGTVHDFVNGLPDLYSRTLRFINDPYQRITEDYLRILRFFRFYAHYARLYDQHSLDACLELAENLRNISRERCTYEFLKLLQAPNPQKALTLMNEAIFTSAGLPRLLPDTLDDLQNSYANHSLSIIGKLVTFDQKHELVLSKKQTKATQELRSLNPMTTLYEYVYWLNTCSPEVMWDGFILSGMLNDTILPEVERKWLDNQFPIQGRDLLELGVAPGPKIREYLGSLMQFFCRQNSPMSKPDLLAYARRLIKV